MPVQLTGYHSWYDSASYRICLSTADCQLTLRYVNTWWRHEVTAQLFSVLAHNNTERPVHSLQCLNRTRQGLKCTRSNRKTLKETPLCRTTPRMWMFQLIVYRKLGTRFLIYLDLETILLFDEHVSPNSIFRVDPYCFLFLSCLQSVLLLAWNAECFCASATWLTWMCAPPPSHPSVVVSYRFWKSTVPENFNKQLCVHIESNKVCHVVSLRDLSIHIYPSWEGSPPI